ncbi:UDP-glucosyltransferase 2 [Drosophila santomea]|uniref:UDP-glucosyltransferase 2 n=1 Tax=Drosophila santomea TaxID=129105 RepID=UPI001952C845|nr:UDP-glucosyltransferase 2 [Drosophila santomea]XP_039494326.1 UDP-glucosyltransferase 2 [Drosophila santomea]XP_039494327.1 UDP-glucosyltransferase 2 [Drosophila santomea]
MGRICSGTALGLLLIGLLLLFSANADEGVQSSRILAVFPFPGRSQYIFAEQFLKELAHRGHNVTVINTFGSDETEPNFRVIGAKKIHEIMAAFGNADYNQAASQWKVLTMTTEFLNLLTTSVLDEPAVKNLLHSGEKFDLVIMETVQTEALFGLSQHFGAETIGISSYGTDTHIDELMGNLSPLSYNPMLLSSRTERMDIKDRLRNVLEACVMWLHKRVVHLPTQRDLYVKYFPTARKSLDEVLDSFSLMLLGQHFSLSYPRPYLPNMIEVGGLHLQQQRKVQPLAKELSEFVEQSEKGVIYFSMGSNIKSKDLPPATRKVLMETFASLPQRVLWKFEDDQLPEKPSNVFISKWFPQPDILAHPNVKLFITHGGLLSTIESIYFGKPVLGLPIFYDQHLNVQRAKQAGYGLSADIWSANATELTSLIQELLSNASYAAAAQTKSKLFRDQKEPALERAIWWTEYVLRHKGAKHLRCASRDLDFIQFHGLDTWGLLIAVTFASILIVVVALKCLQRGLTYMIANRRAGPSKLKTQ